MSKLCVSAFLLLTLCWIAAPAAYAESTAAEKPAAPSVENFLSWVEDCSAPEGDAGAPAKFEAAGCTASYNCVHGGTVSCSSPVGGTCSSSGARCGLVTCDGVTTFCPGSCRTDIHCFTFCGGEGYCDEFGCCVCS